MNKTCPCSALMKREFVYISEKGLHEEQMRKAAEGTTSFLTSVEYIIYGHSYCINNS